MQQRRDFLPDAECAYLLGLVNRLPTVAAHAIGFVEEFDAPPIPGELDSRDPTNDAFAPAKQRQDSVASPDQDSQACQRERQADGEKLLRCGSAGREDQRIRKPDRHDDRNAQGSKQRGPVGLENLSE